MVRPAALAHTAAITTKLNQTFSQTISPKEREIERETVRPDSLCTKSRTSGLTILIFTLKYN